VCAFKIATNCVVYHFLEYHFFFVSLFSSVSSWASFSFPCKREKHRKTTTCFFLCSFRVFLKVYTLHSIVGGIYNKKKIYKNQIDCFCAVFFPFWVERRRRRRR
jgi:hypothetical protein